jgi:hypothetical protein
MCELHESFEILALPSGFQVRTLGFEPVEEPVNNPPSKLGVPQTAIEKLVRAKRLLLVASTRTVHLRFANEPLHASAPICE